MTTPLALSATTFDTVIKTVLGPLITVLDAVVTRQVQEQINRMLDEGLIAPGHRAASRPGALPPSGADPDR